MQMVMMKTGNHLVRPLMVMNWNQCPERVKPRSSWIHQTTRLPETTDPVQMMRVSLQENGTQKCDIDMNLHPAREDPIVPVNASIRPENGTKLIMFRPYRNLTSHGVAKSQTLEKVHRNASHDRKVVIGLLNLITKNVPDPGSCVNLTPTDGNQNVTNPPLPVPVVVHLLNLPKLIGPTIVMMNLVSRAHHCTANTVDQNRHPHRVVPPLLRPPPHHRHLRHLRRHRAGKAATHVIDDAIKATAQNVQRNIQRTSIVSHQRNQKNINTGAIVNVRADRGGGIPKVKWPGDLLFSLR